MSFGFSIGDFLTVGRLVATVVDALNSSSGSSESYQELVSELFSFQRALLEAEEVCRSSSQLHVATINAIKHSVALCRRPIEVFLAKIEKYRRGLNSSSWRKIGWALFKEEEVRKLRCILKMHINCVNLLVVTAGAKSSLQIESSQAKNQVAIIGGIAAQKAELENLRAEVLRSIGILRQLQENVAFKNIGYSWEWSGEAPIRFEDALGRSLLLPLQLVGNWDVFEAILCARFKGFPGDQRVRGGRYRILNSANEFKVLDKTIWAKSVFPGMGVTMSMVFERKIRGKQMYECPRSDCQESNAGDVLDVGTVCKKCKLRFYEGRIVDDCLKYALNQREGNLESSEEYSESNNNEESRGENDEDVHSGYESADDHELRHFRRIHLINHVASDDASTAMIIRNSLNKIHRALRLYSTKFPELDSQFNSLGGLIEAETAFKGSTGTARVPVQSGSLNHVYRELGTLLEKVRVRMNNHRR